MSLTVPVPRPQARGQYLLSLVLTLSFLLTGLLTLPRASGQAVAPVTPIAASPTGGTPRLLWTPQRQAVWNQMVAENNPWWQKIRGWADGSVAKYNDMGDYATIAFQMTGDPKYAQRAWSLIQPVVQGTSYPANLNDTREDFITYVWIYDWL